MKVSAQQISFINRDLFKRGIHDAALRGDLLDHICCLLESPTLSGQNFKDNYEQALQSFGPLRHLALETQDSIDATLPSSKVSKWLERLLTALYLGMALLFFAAPVCLALVHRSMDFILFFSPFMLMGLYICTRRIDYRRFELLPFQQAVFPERLVR